MTSTDREALQLLRDDKFRELFVSYLKLQTYAEYAERGQSDDDDSVFVSVADQYQRIKSGSGKWVLRSKDGDFFLQKLRRLLLGAFEARLAKPSVVSFSLPVSKNDHLRFHPQFDVDRITGEDSDILVDVDETKRYLAVWENFLRRNVNRDIANVRVTLSRDPTTYGGLHVQCAGICVSLQTLRLLEKRARKQFERIHSQYGLVLDSPSSHFIPYCHKSGVAIKTYREVTGSESSVLFPVCGDACGCLFVGSDDVASSDDERDVATAAPTATVRPASTSFLSLDAFRKNQLPNQSVEYTGAAEQADANIVVCAAATIDIDEDVDEIDSRRRPENHLAATETVIVPVFSPTSDVVDNPPLFVESIVEKFLHGSEAVCFLWHTLEQFFLMKMESSLNKENRRKFRYNHKHLALTLAALAVTVESGTDTGRRERNASGTASVTSNTRDVYQFAYYCVNAILRSRPTLRAYVLKRIDRCVQTVTLMSTPQSPTVIEVFYCLLHLALWSGVEPKKHGITGASGEVYATSPIPACVYDLALNDARGTKIIKSAQSVANNDDASSVPLRSIEMRPISKEEALEVATRENALDPLQFKNLLLALTHPYDGNAYWSFTCDDSLWKQTDREHYRFAVLAPARRTFLAVEKRNKSAPKQSDNEACFAIQCCWNTITSVRPFPSGFIVCDRNKIFSIRNRKQISNLPLVRTQAFFATGISRAVFLESSKDPNTLLSFLRSFFKLQEEMTRSVQSPAYFAYPEGKVAVSGSRATLDRLKYVAYETHFEQLVNDYVAKGISETTIRGCVALLELFATPARLGFMCFLLSSIIFENFRKIVIIGYSPEANHGKSNFARVLYKLFAKSAAPLSFTTLSTLNENDPKNPSLVEAAGKTIGIVDEVAAAPKGSNAIADECWTDVDDNFASGTITSKQSSNKKTPLACTLSSALIKTLTGDTQSCGYRKLNENSTPCHFNVALFIFANSFPSFSSVADAERERLRFIRFPRHFSSSGHNVDISRKNDDMCRSLAHIVTAVEYATHDAADTFQFPRLKNHKSRDNELGSSIIPASFGPDYEDGIKFYNSARCIVRLFRNTYPDYFKKEANIVAAKRHFVEFFSQSPLSSLVSVSEALEELLLEFEKCTCL